MAKVSVGNYRAKPVNWGLGVSNEKKTPYVFVEFGLQDRDGLYQTLTWKGYLTEKTTKRTLQSILYCGFQGNELEKLADGAPGKALNTNQEVEIVVGVQTGTDGKTYSKVEWVNEVGGGKAKSTSSEAKSAVKNLNLKADILELRKELGENAPPPQLDEDEPLPF